MDARVADGKLEIIAYVRVETHDIHILDGLIFSHFIVEKHGLRPTPLHGFTGTQWTLSYKGMREMFGFLFKFAFPLQIDLIARSCYLLLTRHGAFISLGQGITAKGGDIPEWLARMPVPKTAKEFVHRVGLGAVNVHA